MKIPIARCTRGEDDVTLSRCSDREAVGRNGGRAVAWFAVVGALAACSSHPIVDMKGVSEAQYARDLQECRSYADQVNVAGSPPSRMAISPG